MIGWRGTVRLAAGSMALCFLGLAPHLLQAGERPHAFLEEMRKRQFFDTALDYLESMRTSPLVEQGFLDLIDYEIGVTLMESARLLPLVDREKRLNESRNAFQKFITEHPQHWLTIDASANLGNLLVDRGRVKVELAARFKRTPEQKAQLAIEARSLYQDAQALFAVIDKELSAKLKEYKTLETNDEKRLAERSQLRTDIMQVRLASAALMYQIAKTHEPGSKEYKENLEGAATKYAEFHKRYSHWVGGYYARIDEARCQQELGDYAKAQSILGEVIAKREFDEGFHRVRCAATVLSLQIALLPQVAQYKEAIELYYSWELNIAQRAESSEEALAIKCLAGQAALECARTMKIEAIESLKQRNDMLQLARDLLTFVTRFPGDYSPVARVKLADPLLSGKKAQAEPPKDYNEARDRARIAWDRMHERNVTPDEGLRLRLDALWNFRFALMHAPLGTPSEDLNTIRYYLAYLNWETAEYYDAAVAGEFLARRFPNRAEAQQAAKLALAAYMKLLGDGPANKDRQFEKDRMIGMAQFITERWPNSPAADDAWMILIRVAIQDRDLDKMVEYLNHVSPESPRRGATELTTGLTLWTAYLNAMRLPKAERPDQAKLAEMFSQSQKALESGVGQVRKPVEAGGEITPDLALGVLYLAQICLDAGQAEKAITWLDDPEIGPHVLVGQNHKVADRGNFREETLKASLRAYVGALALDNIEESMVALENIENRKVDLTELYLNLARRLQRSLNQLRDENQQEHAAAVARGLAIVATHITNRPLKETNFDVLNWVAETFVNLGKRIELVEARLSPEAIDQYRKAAATYQAILDAQKADEKFAPNANAVQAVSIRMAACLRRVGDFGEAIDALIEVFQVNPNVIEAQREAALTYQEWGAEKPGAYVYAILGGNKVVQKDGSTVRAVWGWGGIARKVQSNDAFQPLYHEARYNLVFCRFQYAMSKSGQERTALLNQAERDIVVVHELYPEMGGKERFSQYEALLKRIRRLLGVQEDGLEKVDKVSASN